MLPIIILAGGKGTRLRDVVSDVPKCLAPVGKISFLELLLNHIESFKVKKIYLSLGYKSELVVPIVSKRKSNSSLDWHLEKKPLGTGGAIKACMEKFQLKQAIVINGDTWLNGSLDKIFNSDMPKKMLMTMGVAYVEDRKRYGAVEINKNVITNYGEKGIEEPGYINVGIYNIKYECFANQEIDTHFSFEERIIPDLLKKKAIQPALLDIDFIDIGVPEDYFSFIQNFEDLYKINNC
tara:strand:- start:2632 stop:3342 length:711 start_codon:yes stop_codon:yes gene_type:complete